MSNPLHRIYIPELGIDVAIDVTSETLSAAIAEYLRNHPITETDPTVSAWAKQPTKPTYTASEVGALPASTVIPTVPQMATDPNMTDWTSGKTVDAAALKTDLEMFDGVLRNIYGVLDHKASVSDIPTAVSELTNDSGYQTAADVQTAISGVRQLPAVTASDNGKFLRVVNGAWAAETVQTWQGGSY